MVLRSPPWLEILAFDAEAARHYGRIRTVLKRAGTPIGGNDLLIVAQALGHDAILVTNNRCEFERVPDLRIEYWR